MKILKFGGTSVGTPAAINQVIDIILKSERSGERPVVVVSAFSGVTDQLVNLGNLAAGGENYEELFKSLEARHIAALLNLMDSAEEVLSKTRTTLGELYDALRGVFLIRELSPQTKDFIMSFGERLSAYILAQALEAEGVLSQYLDARILIKTDDNFGKAKVDFLKTNENIRNYFMDHFSLQIATGFIASTLQNKTTTLGRGGSDYTASIFGSALGAEIIEIWTDVDGVMTADPKKVKDAFVISQMSYEEMMEMSHFGAKVICPPTIQPALEQNIPLLIKNTFNPSSPGTLIGKMRGDRNFLIKGISSIGDISLLRVEGSGMIGVAGTAMRLFGALAKKIINVILITQASSEHSVCFAVNYKEQEEAKRLIEEEFALEIADKKINGVIVEDGVSIIAIVGENMRRVPGIAGRIFDILGKNNINVIAIAQGSSELNISLVVRKEDEMAALSAIHENFFAEPKAEQSLIGGLDKKRINIFLVGAGLIGSTLLELISRQKSSFENNDLDVRVIGLADIDRMFFEKEGIDLCRWKEILKNQGEMTNLDAFIFKMNNEKLAGCVFVDCTGSGEVAGRYGEILNSKISIVTPNKKANSGPFSVYTSLKEAVKKSGAKFLYETNVGAALPVISVLRDLLSGGDQILKIEAVPSGTLSYIFNTFRGGKKFSEVVREAKEKGLTEPDPRDDLNGLDAARKLLILAREMGWPLELDDIKVENFLSEECLVALAVDDFFKNLEKMDDFFEKLKMKAEGNRQFLRYIAELGDGRGRVGLRVVASDHPFVHLSGSDNIFAFTTKHYNDQPLVIRGPGAGAKVTAAGLLADILRCAV